MGSHVVEWQLLSSDPESAAGFYRRVFGWSVEAANRLGYRRIVADDAGVAGGIWPAPPEAQPFVQLFVATPDVAASLAAAVDAGATVVMPPQALPDGDEIALFRAPDGISWGLVRRP